MKTYSGPVTSHRRVLCIFPRYTRSFGTFHHAYQFFPDTQAFMPPQGLLIIAAYLPETWEVRVVDESVAPATDEDYQWCDVVLASGMHVQRGHLARIAERAHAHGKIAALGGPSVSACQEYYPTFDLLHVGELGDATDALIERLDASVARPAQQEVYTTAKRLPLDAFPIPAYHKINIYNYFVISIQWSSGCPFTCEFCDIPELYGRNPRLKSPERLIAELDVILSMNPVGGVYFVDDNFIGNKKATHQLLPHLIEWQKRNGYRLQFGCECTLNVAKDKPLLELMREAYITDVFFGVESPDELTLETIAKKQNLRMPLLEAIKIINDHGIELHAGIILGLDNDKEDAADRIIAFVDAANIPDLAINILYALPRTPLWRRLEEEGRLIPTEEVEDSNIEFKLGADVVNGMWKKVVEAVYSPEALYKRYRHNIRNTYPNRLALPLSRHRLTPQMARIGLYSFTTIFLKVGFTERYRREFWRMAMELMSEGHVDHLIYICGFGHHLITFGQEVRDGKILGCFYTERTKETTTRLRPRAFELLARATEPLARLGQRAA